MSTKSTGGEGKLRVLDVYAGTHSATKAFADAGHKVEYVEILEGKDARTYHPEHLFDFVVACPPCTEYSYSNRKFSTWESKYEADPDLWLLADRIIREAKPRLHVKENVKGAQQVWGRAPYKYASMFLWGWFPFDELPAIPWSTSIKGTHADRSVVTEKNGGLFQWDEGKTAEEKAMWPEALSKAVYDVAVKRIQPRK